MNNAKKKKKKKDKKIMSIEKEREIKKNKEINLISNIYPNIHHPYRSESIISPPSNGRLTSSINLWHKISYELFWLFSVSLSLKDFPCSATFSPYPKSKSKEGKNSFMFIQVGQQNPLHSHSPALSIVMTKKNRRYYRQECPRYQHWTSPLPCLLNRVP